MLKKGIICFFVLLLGFVANATTYYSKASGAANQLATWGTNTDGSGANPVNFTSGDIFIVRNLSSLTTDGAWVIASTGAAEASLQINTGGSLTATHAINFTNGGQNTNFIIQNGGTYTHSHATNISTTVFTADVLDFQTGSNFIINVTGTHTNAVGAVFSNLTIDGSSITVTISSTTIYVDHALTITSGNILRFTNTASSNHLSAGGSFSSSGTGTLRIASGNSNPLPADKTWSFAVEYNRAGSQNISSGTYSSLNTVGGDRTITGTVNISGSFTSGGGSFTLTGSTINFTANGSLTIPTLAYNNLTISGIGTKTLGGDLTVNGTLAITNSSGFLSINGNTLTLNGDATLTNGKLIGSASSRLTVSGSNSTSTHLNFNQTTGENNLHTLTLNRTGGGGITLSSDINIINTLTLTNGILATNDKVITLRSTSLSATARVSAVGVGASITYGANGGGIRTERFIPSSPGYRSYRDLGSGMYSHKSFVFDNWQESGGSTSNLGTHITGLAGVAGVDATTGLDRTSSGNRSMHQYASGVWSDITNTKNRRLDPYQGYRILIRGDRNYNLTTFPAPTTMNTFTTLRSTGQLIYGTVTYNTSGVTNGVYSSSYALNGSSGTGFSLIANPYACPISWDAVRGASSNILNTYWYFDPTMGTNGVYVTYDGVTDARSNASSNINDDIQSGQGFFVRNNSSTSPVVVIQESHKTDGSAATAIFNTGASYNNKLTAILRKEINGRGNTILDGAVAVFNSDFSNGFVFGEDAGKITNGGENIAYTNSSNNISIECRKLPLVGDSIHLRVWQMVNGDVYTLQLVPIDFNKGNLFAFLVDKFNGKETLLHDTDTTAYSFTTSTEAASFNNRFVIVFKAPFEDKTISNKGITVTAAQSGTNVNIEWKNTDETNLLYYEVEKSNNGIGFEKMAKQNSTNSIRYQQIDASPIAGKNYYRIKMQFANGGYGYSNIAAIDLSGNQKGIAIYPNPVTGNTIYFQLNQIEKGNYNLRLTDIQGKNIFNRIISHGGGSSVQTLALNKLLLKGTYMLSISATAGDYRQYSTRLIIQ